MKYFIANWKANKNLTETEEWLKYFVLNFHSPEQSTIIICPPYPLIYFTKELVKSLGKNIYLGSQDLSFFEKGSYTGEVTAATLSGLVDYAILGHHERRKIFHEDDQILAQKVNLAQKYKIEPIYCITNKEPIPQSVRFLAYEPRAAIGTGNNQPLEDVLNFKKSCELLPQTKFIYGGSVTHENAFCYLQSSEIDGLLIGTESLNPKEFLQICFFASK